MIFQFIQVMQLDGQATLEWTVNAIHPKGMEREETID